MRTLHDEEAWRDAAQADRARKHRRVDCGSHAGVVAKRLRQALAHTARRLSLLIWFGADPGDDGRGAGSIYLRDLLSNEASVRTARRRRADDPRIFVTRTAAVRPLRQLLKPHR